MKKIFNLTLVFMSVVSVMLATATTYAAMTEGYTLSKSGNDLILLKDGRQGNYGGDGATIDFRTAGKASISGVTISVGNGTTWYESKTYSGTPVNEAQMVLDQGSLSIILGSSTFDFDHDQDTVLKFSNFISVGYALVQSGNDYILIKDGVQGNYGSDTIIDFTSIGKASVSAVTISVGNGTTWYDSKTYTGNPINTAELIFEQGSLSIVIGGSTFSFDHDQDTVLKFSNFNSIDNLRPAISGQENFVTSVDETKPISFFQAYLTAIDETDGNISSSIYIKNDNYTTNKSVLGTYKVTFGVKDAAQNESLLEVNITVADVTKPVISGNTSKATISYTQIWNIATFKSTLTVTDNYATLTNTNITVKNDGYTSNKSNLGTYNVVYAVVDPSGNEGTFTKQVEVIDDVAPVFSGPTILTKPATQVLTVNEIKAQLSATDAKEGNKTSQITVLEDKYTGKGNKVGNYTITFQVADSKGNKSTHVVTISVQDNIPPVWYIQDGVSFKIVQPATLTRQQIIDLLVATSQLSVNATTQITFIIDEYAGNETTPGNYMVSIGYADTAGNEGVHNLTISVLEDGSDNPIVVNPDAGFDIVEFATSPLGIILLSLGIVGVLIIIKKKK